ncbi:MAG: aldo/keto reductase [Phycisphaerales bacterium]
MDSLRPLGSSGILVSPIGLGTVKIGRNTGVKYPRPFDLPSDADVRILLRTAAEVGVNLIDTAPAYGVSEQRLGEALHHLNWLGSRQQWIISTKVGEEFDSLAGGSGASRFDFSAQAVHASVLRSLARLRTDYLDIVLIHSDGHDQRIIADRGAIDALRLLKDRGLVRAIGISIKSAAGGFAAISPATKPHWCDVLMCTLNPSYVDELDLIRAAHARGVGVLIKKAFQSGHLAPDSLGPTTTAAPVDPFAFIFQGARDAASSVVVGTISPDHLRANVAAARRAITSS